MWAYVFNLLNCTPILEWYIIRLVIKNGHPEDMCYKNEFYAKKNYLTIIGLIMNTNWVGWERARERERDHLYSNYATWNDNLCDLQSLLIGWANPTIRNVCGVGRVHNEAAYLSERSRVRVWALFKTMSTNWSSSPTLGAFPKFYVS